MKSCLSIIFFINHAFDVVFKKSLTNLKSSEFDPILSSKSFIVLHFVYIYDPFWVNFCERCTVCTYIYLFFACWYSIVSGPFVEKIMVSHWIAFAPLLVISRLSILPYWFTCLFFYQLLYCLDNCSFLVSLKVGYYQSSDFVLLLQYFVYFGSFTTPYKI